MHGTAVIRNPKKILLVIILASTHYPNHFLHEADDPTFSRAAYSPLAQTQTPKALNPKTKFSLEVRPKLLHSRHF